MKSRIMIIIGVLIVAAMAIGTVSFKKERGDVTLISEKSFLNRYEVKDNKVHIYCDVSLENSSEKDVVIELLGDFSKELKGGLLNESQLKAYFIDDKSYKHTIGGQTEELYLEVEFIGEFGGNKEMSSRLLPHIEVKMTEM